MQTRRFGRTEHMSTVAIFGSFALSQSTQEQADEIIKKVISAGVNHIDVAPSYGDAEERLGPWLRSERQRFFLGCKTMERSRDGAIAEMHASLKRLQTDSFDLYQLHAITNFEELDAVTRPGGALEAIIEAREAGLTRFIGITSHGNEAPGVLLEALKRFDFDTVLLPLSYVQYSNPIYRMYAETLIIQCKKRDVGTMTIKAIAQGPWGDKTQDFLTWYRPFTESEKIQGAVNFVLSQDITGLCTAGDPHLLPLVLEACQNYSPLDESEQVRLINMGNQYQTIFT